MFACSILCGTGQSPAAHVADCAAHGIKPVIGAGILAGRMKLARREIFKDPSAKLRNDTYQTNGAATFVRLTLA